MPKPSLTIQTAMPSIAPNNKDHLVLLTVHHPKQPALTPVRQKLNIAFAIDVSGSMSGCLQGVWKEVPVAPLETALHRGGLQPHPRPVFIGSPYIGTPHIGTPHVGTPVQPWDPNVVPMTPSPSSSWPSRSSTSASGSRSQYFPGSHHQTGWGFETRPRQASSLRSPGRPAAR